MRPKFAPILREVGGNVPKVHLSEPRAGDQKVYISDIRKAKRELDWEPKVAPREGVEMLWNWINANRSAF